jgi:hypothetical protein
MGTIADFMNMDFNELVLKNPGIASDFVAILSHAKDEADKRGTKKVKFGPLHVTDEGYVQGNIFYG